MKTNAILMLAIALAAPTAGKAAMPVSTQSAVATVTNAPVAAATSAAPAAVITNTPTAAAPDTNAAPSPFKSDREKIGYALGLNLGGNLANNWKRQGLKTDGFDLDEFAKGIHDALAGTPPLLTPQETHATLMAFQKTVMDARKQQAAKNKEAGEQFLADNKTKPGVVTLPDGLQYKVLTDGKGDSPTPTNSVTVNYRGTLIDGTEFDSSAKHGQPASFRLGGVIRGWTEALQLMKPGAKWQLYVPATLAYGEAGMPPVIPPDSTLIFDIELLSVSAPPQPPMPPTSVQPVTSDIIRVPSADEFKHGAKPETLTPEQVQKLIYAATNAPANH